VLGDGMMRKGHWSGSVCVWVGETHPPAPSASYLIPLSLLLNFCIATATLTTGTVLSPQ